MTSRPELADVLSRLDSRRAALSALAASAASDEASIAGDLAAEITLLEELLLAADEELHFQQDQLAQAELRLAALAAREQQPDLRLVSAVRRPATGDGPPTAAELFSGTGENQRLLRELDWSATPLGPVPWWPPELIAALRTVLPSRMPMVVWWGPELIQFYNDAFIQFAGDKHPLALGQSGRETWAEVWSVLGPLADAVLAGAGATYAEDELLFMDRAGYSEETYWTFSYSPISDDSGRVAGVLVATSDVTQLVLTSRRLQVSGELRTLSADQRRTSSGLIVAAVERLGEHRADLPFAALYRADPAGAALAASYGLDPAGPALPSRIDRAEDTPVGRVLRCGPVERSDELGSPFPQAWFAPGPLGPLTPRVLCTLPIRIAGVSEPYAVLVVALNPYLYADRDYFSFLSQLAQSLGMMLTDVQAFETERLRAERLAELDAAKTRFFENVSHELRTPLTLMSAPLDLALADENLPLGPNHRADLETAQRAVLRLRQLVDSLLQSSRTGTEEGRPAPAEVDPAALTAELLRLFAPAADAAGLTLTLDTTGLSGRAVLDADIYTRILLNLLSNAMKYTTEGGISVTVTAGADDIVLTVADTGLGVAVAERDLIFDRFHHVEVPGARSQDGTGIGLSLVRDLARSHRGSVTLTDSGPTGSTFTVRLARLEPPDVPAVPPVLDPVEVARPFVTAALGWSGPADDEDAPEAPAPDTAAGGRILLVEDNADMRGYLTRLLRRDGWDVEAVSSVEEALAARVLPELVLSDVMLPGASGVELVAVIRAQPALARIPVLLLTARATTLAAAEALRAGADDYIVKPFDPVELLARVRTHHELSRLREAALRTAEDRAENLISAMESNRRIGTAIGILMQRLKVTEDQAFEQLRRASQRRHRKLREIADEVATTGSLPLGD